MVFRRSLSGRELQPRQHFTYQNVKMCVHAIEEFFGKVWIETTTGSLICERLGSYVEV